MSAMVNGRAQPALFGDGFPQARIVRLGVIVEYAAHDLDGRPAFEKTPRFGFEELLIVAVVEIHGRPSAFAPRNSR